MSRNGSIELSPKYGVNPTISVCFWCGKEKNELALMGRVRKRDPHTGRAVKGSDVEMPMRMVLDYEPCDCCREQFNQGVHLVEVTPRVDDERPAFTKDDKDTPLYPTGRFVVMKTEAVQRIFNMNLEAGKKLCLDKETFTQLMNMMKQSTTNN